MAAPGSGATAAPVLGCPPVVVVVLSGGAFAPEAAAAGVGGCFATAALFGGEFVLAFFVCGPAIAPAMQPHAWEPETATKECMVQVWMDDAQVAWLGMDAWFRMDVSRVVACAMNG